jgi:hypothetical protein
MKPNVILLISRINQNDNYTFNIQGTAKDGLPFDRKARMRNHLIKYKTVHPGILKNLSGKYKFQKYMKHLLRPVFLL